MPGWGGRKTGTAFEITSIPVIAVAPEANARSTSSTPTASIAGWGAAGQGESRGRRLDQAGDHDQRDRATNRYVGAANGGAGSRTPRRLPATSSAITTRPIATVAEPSDGIAEVTASTPEATDTATVRM